MSVHVISIFRSVNMDGDKTDAEKKMLMWTEIVLLHSRRNKMTTSDKNRQFYWFVWLLSSAQSSVVHDFQFNLQSNAHIALVKHAVSSMPSFNSTTSFIIINNLHVWVNNGLKQASTAPHLCIDKIKTTSVRCLMSILQNMRGMLRNIVLFYQFDWYALWRFFFS